MITHTNERKSHKSNSRYPVHTHARALISFSDQPSYLRIREGQVSISEDEEGIRHADTSTPIFHNDVAIKPPVIRKSKSEKKNSSSAVLLASHNAMKNPFLNDFKISSKTPAVGEKHVVFSVVAAQTMKKRKKKFTGFSNSYTD
ncbi:hypothetical protein TNCV_2212771 [Trichonephila clavipes]|nr:hypothetical protein TNCV_2212771 [Trichonephila clavipes]